MRYVKTATRYTRASRRACVRAGVALAALCALAAPALATTYKWVDEHGVVHYTDKVPPEQVDKARIELDKQGVPVKKVDPAPTPEQRKAKEAEEVRQRELARQQEDVARRNKALLQSYTSEAEIDLARKRALSTLDGVIQSAQAYSEQLNKRKEDVERKKAEFGAKPIPAALEREATTVDVELFRQNELIAQKRREAAEVQQKYDAILARWRELTSSREATDAALAAPSPPTGGYTDTPVKRQ
jgi:DNA repair exonuclease SbcCD ATPase subunit